MSNTSTQHHELAPAMERLKVINPRIYISGPMTGLAELNAPAFTLAETIIRELGFEPVNPHKLIDLDMLKRCNGPADEWAFCMKQDIKALMDCGAAIMIKDWSKSIGATWEFLNCKMLKIPTFTHKSPIHFEAPNHDFDLLTFTEPEYVELFYNITRKIKENESLIINEFFAQ